VSNGRLSEAGALLNVSRNSSGCPALLGSAAAVGETPTHSSGARDRYFHQTACLLLARGTELWNYRKGAVLRRRRPFVSPWGHHALFSWLIGFRKIDAELVPYLGTAESESAELLRFGIDINRQNRATG